MDYTTTAEESCSLLSFRIRCPRSRKRAVREDREKRLIKLRREINRLDEINDKLGFEPLDPPIQRGFERSFALREDVAKSADSQFYQNILDRINTKQYHPYRHFKEKKRQKGKKVYVPIDHQLREPCPQSFQQLAFSEKETACFELYPFYFKDNLTPAWYYRFREPWRFVLCIRPHWVDKRKINSVLIESRLKEIDNYLDGRHLWCKIQRMKGWRVTRYNCKETGKFPRERHRMAYWLESAAKEFL